MIFILKLLAAVFVAMAAFSSALAQSEAARLVVQAGHLGNVSALAWSHDGKLVASGGQDHQIKLWDSSTGRELRTMVGHGAEVRALQFSADNRWLVSGAMIGGDQASRVLVWDVAQGQLVRSLAGPTGHIRTLIVSRGLIAAAGSDRIIYLWSLASGGPVGQLEGHAEEIIGLSMLPNNEHLVSADRGGSLRLWSVKTGQLIQQTGAPRDQLLAIAMSFDGRRVATSHADRSIHVHELVQSTSDWQWRPSQLLAKTQRAITQLSFTPDGKQLLAAGLGATQSVQLFNLATGSVITSFGEGGYSMAVHPNGQSLLLGNWKKMVSWRFGQEAQIAQKQLEFAGQGTWFNSQTFSAGSDQLWLGERDQAWVWDLDQGQAPRQVHAGDGLIQTLTILDERRILSRSFMRSAVGVWADGKPQANVLMKGHTGTVMAMAVTLPSAVVATAGSDLQIRLWQAQNGAPLKTLVGHTAPIMALAFTPDGNKLLSAGQDQSVRLWDTQSGAALAVMNGHKNYILSLAVSPDSRSAASSEQTNSLGSTDHRIRVWDLTTGQQKFTLGGHTSSVNSVAFSPDGKALVSAGQDGTVRLWDSTDGRAIATLTGHGASVKSVAFSPNGRWVVSVSEDLTTRFWRARDGAPIATLVAFEDGSWVVTDPQGRFDTQDLESLNGVHWVLPDDPFKPLPLELLMREYYEPRLLARLLRDEPMRPVAALNRTNRNTPTVTIVSVEPDIKPNTEPSAISSTDLSNETNRFMKVTVQWQARQSQVHDLRLFRDGQLVGVLSGRQTQESGSHVFSVQRPQLRSGNVVWSAYAFNEDRIKSPTVRRTERLASLSRTPASAVSKGRAFIISMGVNNHSNPAWDLNFAANDARSVSMSLGDRLLASGQFSQVVSLALMSDGQTQLAHKTLLRATLARLAGAPADPVLMRLPGSEQLQTVTPDDLVIISFAGHGMADEVGRFYLITQDTPGTSRSLTDDLRKASISSDELSEWLREIDARELTLVVDACHSAASVQGSDFKPGPMGARGLGQLAYDKGMRVLAASQADQFALENRQLKQGLLTFALITEGLNAFAADRAPRDGKLTTREWLSFAVQRVPTLSEEVRRGVVKFQSNPTEAPASPGATSDTARGFQIVVRERSVARSSNTRPAQQPGLFDFTRNRADPVLASSP